MKKKVIFLLFCITFLTSCLQLGEPKTFIVADRTQIRVGESVTLTVTRRDQPLQTSPDYDPVKKGFLYSPNPAQQLPAPYAPSDEGFFPETAPELFPVSSLLEISTPPTSSTNVPVLIDTFYENATKATFVLKAKSIGTALLKGGFLLTTKKYPNNFLRIPILPEFDGVITIQIIP